MNRKIVSLFAVTMIALSIVGVSYGLWSKVLYIYGDVDTGDIDAMWSIDGPHTFYTGETMDTKVRLPADLLYKVDMIGVDVHLDPSDYQILHVDILDLYPCIWIEIPLNIENVGSVPWVVQDIKVTAYDDQKLEIAFPGHLVFPNLVGIQVDPYPLLPHYFSMYVHLTNAAAENTVYSFDIEVLCVQWNEYEP